MRTNRTRCALLVAGALAVPACTGNLGDPGEDGIAGNTPPGEGPQKGPDGRYVCDKGPYALRSEARRITPREYANVMADVFDGVVTPSDQYPGSYGKSSTGYSTEAALYAVGEQTVESLMFAAEDVAEQVAGALSTLLPCANTSADEACVASFIDDRIARAYKRAPTAEERAGLLATYQGGRDSGASFTEAMAMLVAHALQSPAFLYVVEDAAPSPRTLSGEEIATRLSFLLWGTVPDDELRAAAADGSLETAQGRRAQAERLLADARATENLTRFFREWSQTSDVTQASRSPDLVPGFDDAMAASLSESFDRFVADQARAGTLQSLLTSNEVWVDRELAPLVGVDPPNAWTKMTIPARDAGIATQPLFLASAAHYAESSYIFRGRFVVNRLTCTTLGAPPGNAQSEFEAIKRSADPTGKELSAIVRSRSDCGACHAMIDPPGLSLEGFGALGEERATYPGGTPVDPSGEVSLAETFSFSDPGELFGALASSPMVASCFGSQVVRFALSRVDNDDDGCSVQEIGDTVAAQGGTIADALIGFAASEAFAMKRE